MKYIVSVLVILFGLSCGMAGEMVLRDNGAARIKISLELFPEMMDYLGDLGELTAEGLSPFDAEKTRESFLALNHVETILVQDLGERGIELEFTTSDLMAFLMEATDTAHGTYFLQEKTNSGGRVEFFLSQGNFTTLIRGFQQDIPPSAEIFLPSEEAPLSQEEYEELLLFILEPYSDDFEQLLEDAVVSLTITLPGEITEANRGNTQGSQWVLTLPLVEVMTLEEPLILRASYLN